MSGGPPIDVYKARAVADKLCWKLAPGCARIEVAGSVRRGDKSHVHDLEICCIPLMREDGLFGEHTVSMLDPILAGLVESGVLERGRVHGPRHRNYLMPRISRRSPEAVLSLDLFITTPERWGVILAIRTGPAALSKLLVTHESRGGLLPDDMIVLDGRLRRMLPSVEVIDTPEERDLFDAIGCNYVEPQDRAAWLQQLNDSRTGRQT